MIQSSSDKRQAYLSLLALGDQNGFKVTCPWDSSYQADMTIWNKRLQSSPALIAFCNKDTDVAACVKWALASQFAFRVRSGGHHHEALSCDWNVLVIDLSNMNVIEYQSADTAWIPPGKELQYVYSELKARDQVIPGGGCETVCVGGLTTGGGWGPYSRNYGLTCDNVLDADVVLADGTLVKNIGTNPAYKDLFWALKGGGHGNFAIITRFLFRLSPLNPIVSQSWPYSGNAAISMCTAWLNSLSETPNKFTTFGRLFVNDPSAPGVVSFVLTAFVFGTQADLDAYIAGISKKSGLGDEAAAELTGMSTDAADANAHFEHSNTPHTLLSNSKEGSTGQKPSSTCNAGPLPHKVSSAFVRNESLGDLAERAAAFLAQNTSWFLNASAYLSLHQFGGAIGAIDPNSSAFPYRDRQCLLQFQAWWNDPEDQQTPEYLNWIENFRGSLSELTDGGFANFQDMAIVPNYNSKDYNQRIRLLKYYYGDNLAHLQAVKLKYDPADVFHYPMSVPPPLKA